MARIIVDGQSFEARDGENLLHACLSAGLDLPYFCWHPAMGSIGACRQCAVVAYQDEDDERGRLTMACMTPVSEGLRISIAATQAREFRESVIEWLMLNHPHDCPVCEEGGECHLQDMTVMSGHTLRRYAGRKRTFQNQYLGPFIGHEMNRCITCYRCVRYYADYAGGTDLQAFGSRSRMYFGRAEDGVLESEFAGNLVEVCPTGVFTDKPFSATYTRKWDLQSAPSVCPGCAIGCNILPGERYGTLKRVHNRFHGDLNGYFLCDRGRFGAAFVNSAKRFAHAGAKNDDGTFSPIDPDTATARLAAALQAGPVIGIGSPRASVESNFALCRLVGAENFCNGMAGHDATLVEHALGILRNGPARAPTLTEIEQADAVLILGEDVSNTAPRAALALRQTAHNEALDLAQSVAIPTWQDAGVRGHAQGATTPFFSATPLATRIDDCATQTRHVAPRAIARLGFHIAAALSPEYPADGELEAGDAEFVAAAAAALRAAQRPLIVTGTGAGDTAVLEAAANVAWALCNAGSEAALMLNVPEANSFGVALLDGGLSLSGLIDRLTNDAGKTTLVVLENDLYRRVESGRLRAALDAADTVVAIDSLENPMLEHADLVLPAATFAEAEGTYVNYETRAQRFYQVFRPAGDIRPGWRWLADAAERAGRNDMGWAHVDAVIDDCAAAVEDFGQLARAGADAEFRAAAGVRIPRQPHRYSGRTAMNAAVNIHEPKSPVDEESPLAFSMEGAVKPANAALLTYSWAPGWNSNQSIMKFQQEVGGHLAGGDPGVRLVERGTTLPGMMRFPAAPEAPTDEALRAVPVFEVFGSDELSAEASAIQERMPQAYVLLHPTDAARLGIDAGDGVRDSAGQARFVAGLDADVPVGHVYYGSGLAGAWPVPPEGPVTLEVDPDYEPPDVIARG